MLRIFEYTADGAGDSERQRQNAQREREQEQMRYGILARILTNEARERRTPSVCPRPHSLTHPKSPAFPW